MMPVQTIVLAVVQIMKGLEPVITIDTFDDVANETQDTASDNTPTTFKPPVSSPVVATDKVSFTIPIKL